ncbi:MAG: DUF6029 family protein [Candidatus Eiseniibacteriota bacterium]
MRRLAVLALLPAVAFADEPALSLGATNKLDYRRLDPEGGREEAFRNRLEVSARHGVFSAWIRLESLSVSDANTYDPFAAADAPTLDAEQRIDRTEVSKRSLTLERDALRVTAGDVPHVFGRGLALSVFEDEELNFDTRLEGVRGQLDHELGALTALGGSHEGNRFRGVFAEANAVGPVRGGASFVEAWGSGGATEIAAREQHAGAFAEVTFEPGSVYAEYVRRDFAGRNGLGELGTPGHGAFVSAVGTVSGLTLSGEFRDMFRFEHPYNDAPTTLTQHSWTLLNREVGRALQDIPDDDVKGYHAAAEYSAGLFTTVQTAFGKIDADDSGDAFWELSGEAKTTWRERVFVTAAAAESEFRFGNIFEERISGFGELVLPLDEANSLTLGAEWSQAQVSDAVTQAFQHPEEFRERVLSASYGRSPWLQATVSYEDTTEDNPDEPRDDWLAFRTEIAVADGHNVTLSYGSERGGWKCTGGVCFFEPEFEGLKLQWVGRY